MTRKRQKMSGGALVTPAADPAQDEADLGEILGIKPAKTQEEKDAYLDGILNHAETMAIIENMAQEANDLDKAVLRKAIDDSVIRGDSKLFADGETIPVEKIMGVDLDALYAAAQPAPVPEAKKRRQWSAEDERRIQKVMVWLENRGTIVRVANHIVYAWVVESDADDVEPVAGLRVWTEYDLVRWFKEAAKHVGKVGCDMDEALDATMPDSREYQPVEANGSVPEAQAPSLFDLGN